MYTQTEFFDFIDKAIEINIKNRIKLSHNKELIPPIQYYSQFCTIRINLGRQTGYTSYIKSHANINSICVFEFIKHFTNNDFKYVNYIFTRNDLKNKYSDKFRGKSFTNIHTIFVDNASFFNNDELYNLYENVSICNRKNTEKTFILLG